MIPINTFYKVEIKSNTLVLCDIDETLLFYDEINSEWWKKKIDYYINVNKCDSSNANRLALNEWAEHIKENYPKHTDKSGFENLLINVKDSKSKLIFITARYPDVKQITEDHFNYLGLKSSEYEVHYLGGSSKGQYIKNIDTDNYDNIIFIDDLDHNITSVNEAFPNNNKLTIYKFIMKEVN